LVHSIAIKVGEPDAMAAFKLVIDDGAVPQSLARSGRGVDDGLETVPRLNGRDHRLSAGTVAVFYFAGASARLRLILIAGADLGRCEFPIGRALQEMDAFIAGDEQADL